MKRCHWVDLKDNEYINYHDTEWGVAVHDERLLFEMLILENFVAGLSWKCVLHKRVSFKQVFDNFDVNKVANYNDEKISQLVANINIIRHLGKIKSAISNAQIFIKIQNQFGSFDKYIWSWTENKTIISNGVETTSDLSDKISKDLKKRGMKFVGSTTIFSYLCAIGIISAHQEDCFLRAKE